MCLLVIPYDCQPWNNYFGTFYGVNTYSGPPYTVRPNSVDTELVPPTSDIGCRVRILAHAVLVVVFQWCHLQLYKCSLRRRHKWGLLCWWALLCWALKRGWGAIPKYQYLSISSSTGIYAFRTQKHPSLVPYSDKQVYLWANWLKTGLETLVSFMRPMSRF
jgi:hypothetical protein